MFRPGSPVRRRVYGVALLGFLASLLTFVAPAAMASASTTGNGPVTSTQHLHGTYTATDFNPCNGDPVDITNDANQVLHNTYWPDTGDVRSTFTEEDKVVAVDQVSGVVLTGHNQVWGDFHVNSKNGASQSGFTSTLQVKGSDGSTISYHENGHFTVNANGVVTVNFDRPTLTCG